MSRLVSGIPQEIVDRMFGLSDAPADRILLAAGRRIGELDPKRLELIAWAISVDDQVGLVGGLDVHERRRLAAAAKDDGVDTSNRLSVLEWLRSRPYVVDGAVRHVNVSRHPKRSGADVDVRRWRRPRKELR